MKGNVIHTHQYTIVLTFLFSNVLIYYSHFLSTATPLLIVLTFYHLQYQIVHLCTRDATIYRYIAIHWAIILYTFKLYQYIQYHDTSMYLH